MTENALPPAVLSRHSSPSPTPLLAAMAPSACHSAATVARLPPHGHGSKELESSQAVPSVKVNSAMITLCHSALTTSQLKVLKIAHSSQLTTQLAKHLAQATLLSTTAPTSTSLNPATPSVELKTSSRTSSTTVQSQLPSPFTLISSLTNQVSTST